MSGKQETSADIIAEMRGARTKFTFVYLMGEPDTPEVIDLRTKEITEPRKINIRRVTVKELADRIEAAHEREREATCEKSSQVGNAAKIREALMKIKECYENDYLSLDRDPGDILGNAALLAENALAEPPRNCDVGTAEEQIKRWQKFCETQTCCEECPCNKAEDISAKCFARWSQMPYESEVLNG